MAFRAHGMKGQFYMIEKRSTQFPVIITVEDRGEGMGESMFLLVEKPEDLPVSKKITIFSTNASPDTLNAVRKAFCLGLSNGRQQEIQAQLSKGTFEAQR